MHKKMFYVYKNKTKMVKTILRNLIFKQNQSADVKIEFCFL